MVLATLKSPYAGRLSMVAAGGYTSGSCLYQPLKSSCMIGHVHERKKSVQSAINGEVTSRGFLLQH